MRKDTRTVVVIGGVNTDYTIRGPRLPTPGATIQGRDFMEGPGGKGANQAVAAARLLVSVALIARLGSDTRGDMLRANLIAEGVDVQYVVRDRENPSGAAVIQVEEGGEKQTLAAPGANMCLTVHDIRAARSTLQEARVVLSQLEVPLECVMEAARLAREAEVAFVLDPAPFQPLPDELFSLLTAIRPNSSEAEGLTGIAVKDRDTAREAADILLERGVKAAAVQAGDEGNLLVWRGDEERREECWMPKLPVDSVDSTGAGDAFAAGLAVMIAEGKPWDEIGPFANATSALATTKIGAWPGLPQRDEVLALLKKAMSYAAVKK